MSNQTMTSSASQGAAAAAAPAPAPAYASSSSSPVASYENDGVDFEIVFGRRQVASTGLVLIVIVACFSGASYLIGRAGGAKALAAAAEAAVAPATTALAPASLPVATVVKAESPKADAPPVKGLEASKPQPPIFAEAISGKVYMQVGAVEKGLAGVWAEGLRVHGLPAFVSAGPSDKMWRVLVGPLPDPKAYQQAKEMLDQLGIATFGKRYPNEPVAQ